MASVIGGLGTVMSYSSTSNGSYTSVLQRVSMDGPETEMGTVETTNLDSTWKTYRATIPDGGTCTLTCQFDPSETTQTGLLTAFASGTSWYWKIAFAGAASGHTVTFEGIVTGTPLSGIEVEGNITMVFTVKVSGPVTYS